MKATAGSQLGWKSWEADGQCWRKSTSCTDQCSCPKDRDLISTTVAVCQGQLLDEGLGWALIAGVYFTDVIKRSSSNLFIPPVLLFQMGITEQDSVKSASVLFNGKELR